MIPTWAFIWWAIGLPLQLWDAGYILLRPLTEKGGPYAAFWTPYQLYITVDKRYGSHESFVYSQSWMNIIEVVTCLYAIFLHYRGRKGASLIFAFSGSLMSLAKTVLYFVDEFGPGNFVYTGHNDAFHFIFLFFLPSFMWVLFPFLVCLSTGKQLVNAFDNSKVKNL